MNRFQTLLESDPASTPQTEQQRASCRLPDVVNESHLHWWTKKADIASKGKTLLLVVAPYSHYDLALLDALNAALSRSQPPKTSIAIYVASLQQYQSFAELAEDMPGLTEAPPQTPIVALWENGNWTESAWGKRGRDLAANLLGISRDDLNEKVVASVPHG